ncbi:MAG: hypothetical protein Q9192_003450 [Flavoplaca navasiana]
MGSRKRRNRASTESEDSGVKPRKARQSKAKPSPKKRELPKKNITPRKRKANVYDEDDESSGSETPLEAKMNRRTDKKEGRKGLTKPPKTDISGPRIAAEESVKPSKVTIETVTSKQQAKTRNPPGVRIIQTGLDQMTPVTAGYLNLPGTATLRNLLETGSPIFPTLRKWYDLRKKGFGMYDEGTDDKTMREHKYKLKTIFEILWHKDQLTEQELQTYYLPLDSRVPPFSGQGMVGFWSFIITMFRIYHLAKDRFDLTDTRDPLLGGITAENWHRAYVILSCYWKMKAPGKVTKAKNYSTKRPQDKPAVAPDFLTDEDLTGVYEDREAAKLTEVNTEQLFKLVVDEGDALNEAAEEFDPPGDDYDDFIYTRYSQIDDLEKAIKDAFGSSKGNLMAADQKNLRPRLSLEARKGLCEYIGGTAKVLWPTGDLFHRTDDDVKNLTAKVLGITSRAIDVEQLTIGGDPELLSDEEKERFWALQRDLNSVSAHAPEYEAACKMLNIDPTNRVYSTYVLDSVPKEKRPTDPDYSDEDDSSEEQTDSEDEDEPSDDEDIVSTSSKDKDGDDAFTDDEKGNLGGLDGAADPKPHVRLRGGGEDTDSEEDETESLGNRESDVDSATGEDVEAAKAKLAKLKKQIKNARHRGGADHPVNLELDDEAKIQSDAAKALPISKGTSYTAGPSKKGVGWVNLKLYHWQINGVAFLVEMELGPLTGCILGDDMGLGKTLQALTLIQVMADIRRKEWDNGSDADRRSMKFRPTLIAYPSNAAGPWKEELARHFPMLNVRYFHGSVSDRDKQGRASKLGSSYKHLIKFVHEECPLDDPNTLRTVILTTYQTYCNRCFVEDNRKGKAVRELNSKARKIQAAKEAADEVDVEEEDPNEDEALEQLAGIETAEEKVTKKRKVLRNLCPQLFGRVICDEAHRLKNKDTDTAQAIRKTKADFKIYITATSMLNKAEDLHGLLCQMWKKRWGSAEALTLADYEQAGLELSTRPELTRVNLEHYLKFLDPTSFLAVVRTEPGQTHVSPDVANLVIPTILRLVQLRRVISDKMMVSGEEMQIGSHIPPYRIVSPELEMSSAQREVYMKAHRILSKQMKGSGSYDEDTKEGRINQAVHRFLCLNTLDPNFDVFRTRDIVTSAERVATWADKWGDGGATWYFNTTKAKGWTLPPLERRGMTAELAGSSVKLSWIIGILNKIVNENNEKALVFTNWPWSIWRVGVPLLSACFDVMEITASMSVTQRERVVRLFNKPGEKHKVLLVSTRTTSASVNLQACCWNVIFAEVPFSTNTTLQAIGRLYRIGQKKTVNVYIPTVDGTYDQVIQHRCALKMSGQIGGQGDVRPSYEEIQQHMALRKAMGDEALSYDEVDRYLTEKRTDALLVELMGQQDSRKDESWGNYADVTAKNHWRREQAKINAKQEKVLQDINRTDGSNQQSSKAVHEEGTGTGSGSGTPIRSKPSDGKTRKNGKATRHAKTKTSDAIIKDNAQAFAASRKGTLKNRIPATEPPVLTSETNLSVTNRIVSDSSSGLHPETSANDLTNAESAEAHGPRKAPHVVIRKVAKGHGPAQPEPENVTNPAIQSQAEKLGKNLTRSTNFSSLTAPTAIMSGSTTQLSSQLNESNPGPLSGFRSNRRSISPKNRLTPYEQIMLEVNPKSSGPSKSATVGGDGHITVAKAVNAPGADDNVVMSVEDKGGLNDQPESTRQDAIQDTNLYELRASTDPSTQLRNELDTVTDPQVIPLVGTPDNRSTSPVRPLISPITPEAKGHTDLESAAHQMGELIEAVELSERRTTKTDTDQILEDGNVSILSAETLDSGMLDYILKGLELDTDKLTREYRPKPPKPLNLNHHRVKKTP